MAKKTKKISKIKVKKKVWYKVIAPKIFANKEVGESYLQSPESAVGRKLNVNLKDLSGNIKDQNVQISLQITNVDGSLLKTSVTGYQLTTAYVKRCIRKNCTKIDDYFLFKTKGGKKVVLKSLIITSNKTQRSVKTKISNELGKLLEEEIKSTDLATFISKLVTRRVQLDLKKKLKKISPLKEVSVRSLKIQEKGIVKEEIVVDDKTKTSVEEKVAEEIKEEVKEEIKDDIPASPETKTKKAKEEAAEKISEEVKEEVEEVAEEIAEEVKEGE